MDNVALTLKFKPKHRIYAVFCTEKPLEQLFMFQTGFMEDPYGTCGHKPLDLFPNTNYTFSHCQRQCDAKALLSECDCTEPYMSVGSQSGICTIP